MARELGYERLGLASLAQELLGQRLAKGKARSNWANRQLTPEQLSYAATDAFATLLVYNELEAIEVEEDYEPYWTVVHANDDEAAVNAQRKPVVAADPRIDELTRSVQTLNQLNANMAARLAAVEAETQRARAAFEQRIATLEAENRRLLAELARISPQYQQAPVVSQPAQRQAQPYQPPPYQEQVASVFMPHPQQTATATKQRKPQRGGPRRGSGGGGGGARGAPNHPRAGGPSGQ
ncbi:uncharacterized protein ACA1_123200 [Acanthamoeba castellanii str. Neff]|uniref:3'-5' exonuclease domain-containing protein n=1 Tax=Acanthamoeba castellanii (strain ATCC 30010 / Neff) TaxID=1257118 RepID=L8HF17_ACACF|nr:uncharacterized protein ACA1_123200 [Acanthamoeba castellanii str. Neff]ELR23842.1 hypothetical protein ACA1_123200 [Acanthamoeba castellanii str. Neff]